MPAAEDDANPKVLNQSLQRKEKIHAHIKRLLSRAMTAASKPNDGTKP